MFPVISGADVNAGVATVGSRYLHGRRRTRSTPSAAAPASRVNRNSFEINGNLYTITGTPAGADYSGCQVVGDAMAPQPFLSANTFELTDPNVTYTLHLDAANCPRRSRRLPGPAEPEPDEGQRRRLSHHLQHGEHGIAAGPGPGLDPDRNSGFTLTNPFDSTDGEVHLRRPEHLRRRLGRRAVHRLPGTDVLHRTATLSPGPSQPRGTDNDKRPYPADAQSDDVQHQRVQLRHRHQPRAARGRSATTTSPRSRPTLPCRPAIRFPTRPSRWTARSTPTPRTPAHNLLTITGTKSYMVTQPGAHVQARLQPVFTLSPTPPGGGQLRRHHRSDRHGHGGHARRLNLYAGVARIRRRRLLHVQERALHDGEVGGAHTSPFRSPTRSMSRNRRRASSNWRSST